MTVEDSINYDYEDKNYDDSFLLPYSYSNEDEHFPEHDDESLSNDIIFDEAKSLNRALMRKVASEKAKARSSFIKDAQKVTVNDYVTLKLGLKKKGD